MLVLGGYGGFGARLTHRLVGHGHSVLVAGRNAEKAAAFCASVVGTTPIVADRDGDIGRVLADHRPDLLIDAAGPFQGSGYQVALACAKASVPYIDLADARGFVVNIGTLNEAARAGNVPIISGASSVPALSGAVARHLAEGMDTVRSVEMAISASNRATSGVSVAAAILSYVGKPISLWRGGRWTQGWGWQELRRDSFRIPGKPPLPARWFALADVPDNELMPDMLPGRPAVTFRAGTDISLQTLGLWLISWPVRWLRIASLEKLAPLIPPLQRLTRFLGSDRSGMRVTLKGTIAGRRIERSWILLADNGDGPEIPTLAAAILTEVLVAGKLPAGAYDAGRLLALRDFEPVFTSLSIDHDIAEAELPQPLYGRILSARFARLPDAVRELHDICADGGAAGEAYVERGRSPAAGLIARVMGFPPAGKHALHVAFSERNGVETWTREFGRHRLRSYLSERDGQLVERFGPLRFRFALVADPASLEMQMRGWSWLGIPMPMLLAPRSYAREWQEGGRFRFDVSVSLPLIGLIVRYTGWLTPHAHAHIEGQSSRRASAR
ncbi:DUF4166 domain-containing protein [Pelagibacterium halotolerans]|uniref:DUF4166 domain-containing protein n=1 Tax=Pelagibacterium halotolerans TaxID=531813 RepID=UPI00384D0537